MTDVKLCRCGHSAVSHIYPAAGPTMYGDCHQCRCELYNPPGGIKGIPIHPLFAFTEDEFRFIACVNCERFRVLPDGVCEVCGWDNDNNGMVGSTRPDHPLHSLMRSERTNSTIDEPKTTFANNPHGNQIGAGRILRGRVIERSKPGVAGNLHQSCKFLRSMAVRRIRSWRAQQSISAETKTKRSRLK